MPNKWDKFKEKIREKERKRLEDYLCKRHKKYRKYYHQCDDDTEISDMLKNFRSGDRIPFN